jgi:hypothetical protein
MSELARFRYELDEQGIFRQEDAGSGIRIVPRVAEIDEGVLELIKEYRRAD